MENFPENIIYRFFTEPPVKNDNNFSLKHTHYAKITLHFANL